MDSSSILTAWVESYAPDVFPSFWDLLDPVLDAGLVVSPEEVRDELRLPSELQEWAKARSGMFRDLDNEVQDSLKVVVGDIQKDARRQGFKLRPRDFRADPVVVALARVTGTTVISEEGMTGPGGGRPRIPNLCRWYGLRSINLLTFIREQGWRF